MPLPRIKICCIRDAAEAALAISRGVDALGLVSAMPSGPGVIDDTTIAAIAATVPPPIATFLLTSLTDAGAIIEQQRLCRCNTLQLVDAVPPGTHARLRAALPGIALVQVIHVVDSASVDEAVALAPEVDALLLDSGNPALAVKELGGTGRVHDWALSRAIVERSGKPVFLAGGLRPDNVAEAIRTVRPFGLDLCNGVRRDGRLDADRLAAFDPWAARSGVAGLAEPAVKFRVSLSGR
ncbi:MAG: N-(5'-phosphoribosyl)anthranilate isomerase [Lysobacteraceae bacterium SCN 69-25]|nr:MAG: N-(5'-phosphoribosyl)anthranilate isomerase [Xanthomonadaceae bacterium SCN 69-25]